MKAGTYTVVFQPAEEGGYTVTCPALPGLVTEGDTLEEAQAMAQDAIRLYLQVLLDEHEAFPGEDNTVNVRAEGIGFNQLMTVELAD